MAGETTATIVGSACSDPELKYTGSGVAVCSVTIASNSRHFDKASGEWQDDPPIFMRCNIWRQMAECVAESVVKGTRLIVTGRLKQRSFESKSEKRTVIELDVDEIGPSLKWATAKINRASRSGGDSAPADDPWSTAPAGSGTADYADDPPPF